MSKHLNPRSNYHIINLLVIHKMIQMNLRTLPQLLLSFIFLLIPHSSVFSSEAHHTHAAHVHGEAEMYIVYEHGKLFIEFLSPTINLIGFEHPPQNEKQRAALVQTKQILSAGNELFQLDPPNCRLESASVTAPYLEKAPYTEHHHPEGEHPDFHASYTFNCEPNAKLTAVHITLLTKFPGIEFIKVLWISQNQQGSTRLTPDQATITLK